MKKIKHIILKQHVDIVVAAKVDAFTFKDSVSMCCTEQLLPAIEKLFDQKGPKNKIWHADKIVIDVGEVLLSNWQEVFVERVIEQLMECIGDVTTFASNANPTTTREVEIEPSMDNTQRNILSEISEAENLSRSILFFLENGRLPWYASIKTQSALNESFLTLCGDGDFVRQLIRTIGKNQQAFERLIYQLSESAILALVIQAGFETASVVNLHRFLMEIVTKLRMASNIANDSASAKYVAYDLLLKAIIEYEETEGSKSDWDEYFDIILHLIAKRFELGGLDRLIPIFDQSTFESFSERALQHVRAIIALKGTNASAQTKDSLSSDGTSTQRKFIQTNADLRDDGVFVSNAGLVILHPFLPLLFENVGYIYNKEWVSNEHKQRALVLTQFMITGREEFPEFDLLLNKILVGFPTEKTLPAEIFLSAYERQEATDVLRSVIKHWTALKNTSIDGLQSAFLAREGKLTIDKNGYRLLVEHKTMDILMNRIPWGFSIVKTPWMKDKLIVDWN